jgi:hypothetical protein
MTIGEFEVRPLKRDPSYVDLLESHVRSVPNFLGKDTLWSLSSQVGSSFFEIGNCGLVGVVNTHYGRFADAHITFWDGQLEGKEEVCKEVARFIIEACRLHFLLTYIPAGRTNLIAFAERLGFIKLEINNGVVLLGLFKEKVKWE